MTQDLEATTAELRELATEIRDHHSLMLKLDLEPENAALHRELLDLANEALEDIALAERRRSTTPGPPAEAARPPLDTLWAEWNGSIKFLSRSKMSAGMKSAIIRRFGVKNYARLPE
jgi:hypothetical protein